MVICYFGTLTDKRKTNWNNGDDNPYDVVKENIKVDEMFFYRDCFKDEIWIDWGSTARRISGKELLEAMHRNGVKGKTLKHIPIVEDEEYGFVWIDNS